MEDIHRRRKVIIFALRLARVSAALQSLQTLSILHLVGLRAVLCTRSGIAKGAQRAQAPNPPDKT